MIEELMRTRRSIRRFKPEVPSRELVERLIAAATTAPSAGNKQPWRFLAITNQELIRSLAGEIDEATRLIADRIVDAYRPAFLEYARYFAAFRGAPLVIVPLFRRVGILSTAVEGTLPDLRRDSIALLEHRSGIISVSLAVQNLLLAAHALGLGASFMSGPLVAEDRVRARLDVQPSWEVLGFIAAGFPDEGPAAPPRKPVAQVLRWIE